MKELLGKLFAALPAYTRQAVSLLSGPKAFIARQDLDSPEALQEAFTFLAISFALAYIAEIPFLPETQNKELMFGVLAIQSALAFLLIAGLAVFSWKAVGAKAVWTRFVATSCYFCGISTLLFLAVYLLASGMFASIDPTGYKQMLSGAADPADYAGSGGAKAFLAIVSVGFLFVYFWIYLVWGAYRELTQVSKFRSGIAFTIFVTLSPVAFFVQALMARTALPARDRPQFPAELAGTWQTPVKPDGTNYRSAGVRSYMFLPSGLYAAGDMKISKDDNPSHPCLKITTNNATGNASVQGSTLTLAPRKHTETREDSCSGTKSEIPMSLDKEIYTWQIHQRPTGWELCLNGRFGETCLTPKKQ